jgi:pimeloyl-ACP methyl ester carboxylesterase
MQIQSNGLQLEIQVDGPEDGVPLLLIAGIGQQLIDWPDLLIAHLLDSGFRIIRFDHRDVGYSQNLKELGVPSIPMEFMKSMIGLGVNAPYKLSDMAADAKGILDALGIAQAHILGWSMGGMIVQRFALAYPQSTLSMTCIMTSSGVAKTRADILNLMRTGPSNNTFEAKLAYAMRINQMIMSPAYPEPEERMRARLTRSIERSLNAKASGTGTQRQTLAILQDAGRAREIHQIRVPTLVLHGNQDPMVGVSGGRDIASKIAGAKFVEFDGMGHDYPHELIPEMVREIQLITGL